LKQILLPVLVKNRLLLHTKIPHALEKIPHEPEKIPHELEKIVRTLKMK